MDGAGTIFDKIEERLSTLGVNAGIGDLKEAVSQYDAKIGDNPSDLDSKMVGLELKVAMLARLLDAAVCAMGPNGSAAPAEAPKAAATTAAASQPPARKVKRLRQNPATGIIEEIEDTEDNVIVADMRSRYRGDPKKDGKKTVFIAAADDEPVSAANKKH